MTAPPTELDKENAAMILDHVQRLREIGEIAGEGTRQQEVSFIACMLRNERIDERSKLTMQLLSQP